MSWLVAVCVPGLLMIGAVGLQRMESVLQDGRSTATGCDAPPARPARTSRSAGREHTEPLPMKTLPSPIPASRSAHLRYAHDTGQPTRLRTVSQPNPHFQPAGYANRV